MVPVLIVGEVGVSSGYARVLLSLVEHVQTTKYQLHVFGIAAEASAAQRFHCAAGTSVGSVNFGSTAAFSEVLRKLRPAILVIAHDLRVAVRLASAARSAGSDARIIAYTPVDGVQVDPRVLNSAEKISRIVTFSQCAVDAIHRTSRSIPGFAPLEVDCIPLGVSTRDFRPLVREKDGSPSAMSRTLARQFMFPERSDLHNRRAFVVLNANRNHIRKRIDVSMEGFARFAVDKPKNVYLCLHMGSRDRLGWDLRTLVKRLGLEDRVLFTSSAEQLPVESDAMLNLVYNACDVGLNTSDGEGFGLVAFEHAATGAAQVLPSHTACLEYWRDSAVLVASSRPLVTTALHIRRCQVGPDEVARNLGRLHADLDFRREMSMRAYRNATGTKFDWSTFGGAWSTLLDEELEIASDAGL